MPIHNDDDDDGTQAAADDVIITVSAAGRTASVPVSLCLRAPSSGTSANTHKSCDVSPAARDVSNR